MIQSRNARDWQVAVAILQRMMTQGISPTLSMFNILCDVLCKCQQYTLAHSAFSIMQQIGLVPDAFTYTTFISAYARSGNADMAYSIFTHMQLKSVTPTRWTFNSMVTACAKSGKYEQAFKWIQEMRLACLSPDMTSFGPIVHSLGKDGRIDDAFKVFGWLLQKDLNVTQSIFDGLMRSCIAAQRAEMVHVLLVSMEGHGLWPHESTLELMRSTFYRFNSFSATGIAMADARSLARSLASADPRMRASACKCNPALLRCSTPLSRLPNEDGFAHSHPDHPSRVPECISVFWRMTSTT